MTTGNSGGLSGIAFDEVSSGTGAAVEYDSTHAHSGGLSLKVTTGGTSTTSYAGWTTAIGTTATMYGRAYLFFEDIADATTARTFQLWKDANGRGGWQLDSGGHIQSFRTGGTVVQTSSTVLSANQWYRIEWQIICSTTVGQVVVKIFTSPDAIAPAETLTSAATLNMGGADCNRFSFGNPVGNAADRELWFDDLGISSTGWLGPSSVSTLQNTLEGSNGTTITTGNSGGALGDPWDDVTIGSGATLAYDTGRKAHGAASMKVASSGTAASSVAQWDTSFGHQGILYGRCAINLDLTPAVNPLRVFWARGEAVARASVGIDTARKVIIARGDGTIVGTSTTVLTLDTWYRLEFFLTLNANGTCDVRIYAGVDTATITETLSVTAQDFRDAADEYRWGSGIAQSSQGPIYLDDLAVSTVDWLGPYAFPAGGTATQAHSATGAAVLVKHADGTAAQALSATGAAVLVIPATGTAAQSMGAAGAGILQATGTAAQAHAATGTGDLIVPEFPAAGTASQAHSATGAGVLVKLADGTASQAHAATGAGIQLVTGAASQAHAASGDAILVIPVTGTATQAHVGVAGAAQLVTGSAAQAHAGSGAATLVVLADGAASQAHTGSGELAQLLDATATQAHSATGDATLVVPVTGTADQALSATGSGILLATGTATQTHTGVAGAAQLVTGSAAQTLAADGAALTVLPVTGAADQALSASGDLVQQLTGTAAQTLAGAGDATLVLPASGTATQAHVGVAGAAQLVTGAAGQAWSAAGSAILVLLADGTASQAHTATGELAQLVTGAASQSHGATGAAVLVISASGTATQAHVGVAGAAQLVTGTAALSHAATGELAQLLGGAATQAHTGTGDLSWPASGTASQAHTASGSAALLATGAAAQSHQGSGDAVLVIGTSGTATQAHVGAAGAAQLVTGAATQAHTATGAAILIKPAAGSALQDHDATGVGLRDPLTNAFEARPHGTTINSTDPRVGDDLPFSTISLGPGVTFTYDNTRFYQGALSLKVATGGTLASASAEWDHTDLAPLTAIYGRAYVNMDVAPASLWRLFWARGAAVSRAAVSIGTDRKVNIVRGDGTIVATSTTVLALDAWYRLEWHFELNATGAGTLRIYADAGSATITETVSIGSADFRDFADEYRFGTLVEQINQGPFYLDAVGISSLGWLGAAPITVLFGNGPATQTLSATGAATLIIPVTGTASQAHAATAGLTQLISGTASQSHAATGGLAQLRGGTASQTTAATGSAAVVKLATGAASQTWAATGAGALQATGTASQSHQATSGATAIAHATGTAAQTMAATSGAPLVTHHATGTAAQGLAGTSAVILIRPTAGVAIQGHQATGAAVLVISAGGTASQGYDAAGVALLVWLLVGLATQQHTAGGAGHLVGFPGSVVLVVAPAGACALAIERLTDLTVTPA